MRSVTITLEHSCPIFVPRIGQLSHSFFEYDDASAWLRTEQKLIEFDEWTAPASRNLSKEDKARTVGDWCKEWMEIRRTDTNPLEPSTAQDYWKALNTRILHSTGKAGYLRSVPLTQLSRRDVAARWDAINVQFDGKTTNHNAYKRLKTIMTAAVRREMIPANPVDIPEASRRPKAKIKELHAKQVMQDIVDGSSPFEWCINPSDLFIGLGFGIVLDSWCGSGLVGGCHLGCDLLGIGGVLDDVSVHYSFGHL